jgi:tRNA(fMet)-specific endonuclease VapC
MLQYMLDTNICTHVVKNYPPKLRERFNRLAEQLCISSVTLAELCYGAEKSARRLQDTQAIEHFVGRLEILSFSPRAAAHYGQIRAELERRGRPVGPYHMLIAAHARAEGLTIVTNNIREFRRIPGMQIENWV